MNDDAPPGGSQILVDRQGNDVTLTVPPRGMWQPGGTANFSCLGLIILLALIIATAGFSAALIWDFKGARDMWLVLPILGVLWLVGLAVLLVGINLGRRRAALAVVGENVLVLQTGLFGSKRREWHRDQIEDVCTGPSNVGDIHGAIMELQIRARSGEKFGLLAGHAEADLEWMAVVLRGALRGDKTGTGPVR